VTSAVEFLLAGAVQVNQRVIATSLTKLCDDQFELVWSRAKDTSSRKRELTSCAKGYATEERYSEGNKTPDCARKEEKARRELAMRTSEARTLSVVSRIAQEDQNGGAQEEQSMHTISTDGGT
jgi:hypothetical protein